MADAIFHQPAEGAAELLFLLMHGGAERPESMQPLATALSAEYPQAAVVCLQAPRRAGDAPPGDASEEATRWQYYPTDGLTDDNLPERVGAAIPGLIDSVRALQRRFEMEWQRTALCGFSQGAIVALEAVQCEAQLAGRVLAFGGRHAVPPDHAPADTTVHLLHGLADTVEPHAHIVDSARRLIVLGGDVTADVLPGVGHELDPRLIAKALEQLRTFLPRRVWREAVSEAPIIPRPASSRELG